MAVVQLPSLNLNICWAISVVWSKLCSESLKIFQVMVVYLSFQVVSVSTAFIVNNYCPLLREGLSLLSLPMVSLWLQFYWSPILTFVSQSPCTFWWCSEGAVTFSSTPNHRTWFSSSTVPQNAPSQPGQYQQQNWIGCCLKQPLFLWPEAAVILDSRQDIFFLDNEDFLYSSSANCDTRVSHGITLTCKQRHLYAW